MRQMYARNTFKAAWIYKETKKEYKSLNKQEIYDIFIKRNYIKLVFNSLWQNIRDKAFNIAKNPKYDGYQKSWFNGL